MTEGISTNQFLNKVRAEVKRLGGQVAAAEVWGMNAQHIGGAIRGERTPSPIILNAMGYEPIKEIKYRYRLK